MSNENFNNEETNNLIPKKGRKTKQKNYFDVTEENAVIDFLSTDSET